MDKQQFLNKFKELQSSANAELREVLKLWLVEGKSDQEIANALDKDRSTATRKIGDICKHFGTDVHGVKAQRQHLVLLFRRYCLDFEVDHSIYPDWVDTSEISDRPLPPLTPTNQPNIPIANLTTIPPCPYRGLFAFREEDADLFFGRDKFTEELVTAVIKKLLVTVIGRSGSGKSSVIFAGLIPKLSQQGRWLFANFRPENRPLYNLSSQLNKLLIPQWETISQNDQRREIIKLADDLRHDTNVLQYVIGDILSKQQSHCRLRLVIDQFEELYTISPEEERQPFLNQLLKTIRVFSAKQTIDFGVVLTLRDDFLGHALDSSLGEALQEFKPEFLSAMTREQLQEAIEKPAVKQGVIIEDCLTERILDAVVGEPGILPCMEFALTQLWERLKSSNTENNQFLLNHRSYIEIGGVEKALANHADRVFKELDDHKQQQVK